MSKPDYKREGDWHIFTWPEHGIGIGLDHVREASDGLHAEITVQSIRQVDNGRSHIHWARLNLSSTQARERLAEKLAKQTGIVGWQAMLEQACVIASREHRRGEPIINLAELPVVTEVKYLVSKLLPSGQPTLLVADGMSCKSWLALMLCVAVRTGTALPCGIKPMRQCGALYLDWETNEQELRRRLEYVSRGLGLTHVPDVYYRRMLRPLADDAAKLRAELARLDIGLVVVDSAAPATGGEPKEAEPVLRLMAAIQSFSPATAVILAHVSKEVANQKGGRGRAFGSVFYENLGRSVWELRAENEGATAHVAFFHRKTNLGRLADPFGLSLCFDDKEHRVLVESAAIEDIPELAERTTLAWRIRTALRHGAKTTEELAKICGTSDDSVRGTIRRMADVIRLPKSGTAGSAGLWGLRIENTG